MIETKVKTRPQVTYRFPHAILANEFVNRFAGKEPIAIIEITDENGKLIFNEDELKKRGAVFATADVVRDLSDSMAAKSRINGEDNPFKKTRQSPKIKSVFEKYKIQYLLNAIWQNVVDNKRDKVNGIETGYKSKDSRSNGIENYRDSRVVCHKIKDGIETFYINYVVLRYLSERIVVDENGVELDAAYVESFMKQSKESKQQSRETEAEKHGIPANFDPQIRQIKMSNIDNIKVFGVTFKPQD